MGAAESNTQDFVSQIRAQVESKVVSIREVSRNNVRFGLVISSLVWYRVRIYVSYSIPQTSILNQIENTRDILKAKYCQELSTQHLTLNGANEKILEIEQKINRDELRIQVYDSLERFLYIERHQTRPQRIDVNQFFTRGGVTNLTEDFSIRISQIWTYLSQLMDIRNPLTIKRYQLNFTYRGVLVKISLHLLLHYYYTEYRPSSTSDNPLGDFEGFPADSLCFREFYLIEATGLENVSIPPKFTENITVVNQFLTSLSQRNIFQIVDETYFLNNLIKKRRIDLLALRTATASSRIDTILTPGTVLMIKRPLLYFHAGVYVGEDRIYHIDVSRTPSFTLTTVNAFINGDSELYEHKLCFLPLNLEDIRRGVELRSDVIQSYHASSNNCEHNAFELCFGVRMSPQARVLLQVSEVSRVALSPIVPSPLRFLNLTNLPGSSN